MNNTTRVHMYGGDGMGPTLDADYLLWEAQFNVIPPEARRILLSDLVAGLKTDGLFSKLDRFFIFAMHDQQAARVSMVNPSSAQIVEVNTPVFTTDRSYKTNAGRTAYLNTNYNPSSDGVNYLSTSASAGVYVRSWTDAAGQRAFGAQSSTNAGLSGNPANATPQFQGNINTTNVRTSTISGNDGLIALNKLTGGELVYRNGTGVGLGGAGNTIAPFDVFVLGSNKNGSVIEIINPASEISAHFTGGSLTATEHLNLFTRLETYLDAIGAGVIP